MVIYSTIFLAIFQAFVQVRPPAFDAQVVDGRISIGYGLAIGDVDGDRKPDILLADQKQFVWYRNGDWKRFVMVENLTEYDNVCLAARDIDGDGKVEVAVGGQWNPSETSDTTKSGAVYYLRRPKDPTGLWTPVKLHHEPTVHRMRWIQIAADRFTLLVVPLHGRGNKNGAGKGVRVLAYTPPARMGDNWNYAVVDTSMHMTHNFDVVAVTEDPKAANAKAESVLLGGREGIRELYYDGKTWRSVRRLADERGFGEVRASALGVAGISPMHGNQVVMHSGTGKTVLTSEISQGHALAAANVIGDERPEIIVGWREPDRDQKTGIKIFVVGQAPNDVSWKEYWLDENQIACEDLVVADLNADGKPDIVAAGRATHNLKIYWNRN
ncbi:MAG TPA: VCBS repeat-containing protein [Chryseosolibacter sp.]|nr:VCBS repeat-containing protein [Chryseosolibacter sp.]